MSARQVYLWIKYLRGITHYDDEDGWFTPENKKMNPYTYKKILHRMTEGDWVGIDIFEVLRNSIEFAQTFIDKNIKSTDQLNHYVYDSKYRLK